MDVEQVNALITTALEPLLARIIALETENQEIKAILKNMPQPKVNSKPAPVPVPATPNTQSVKKLPPASKHPDGDKKGTEKKAPKVEEEKQSEDHESGSAAEGEAKPEHVLAGQKKQPVTKPSTATGTKKPTEPKKPVPTPVADKKIPTTGTTGRASIGNAKGPKKTESKEQQKKEEEGKHEGDEHETKQQPKDETELKDHKESKKDKSKQKKPVHAKPSHTNPTHTDKDKPAGPKITVPATAKPKPGVKETAPTTAVKGKPAQGSKGKVEESSKDKKNEGADKVEDKKQQKAEEHPEAEVSDEHKAEQVPEHAAQEAEKVTETDQGQEQPAQQTV